MLYMSLAAPLAGATFGISLTSDLVIPDFIASVIRANPLYNVLYSIALIALALAGAVYVFTFHFVVLGDLTVKEAMRRSGKKAPAAAEASWYGRARGSAHIKLCRSQGF